jgi:hypothetical protein
MRVHLDTILVTTLSATLLAGAANVVAAPLTPQKLAGVDNGESFLGISCTYQGVYLEEGNALSCVGRPRQTRLLVSRLQCELLLVSRPSRL